MKLWIEQLQQAGLAFWSLRDTRERKFLLSAGVFISVALFYLVLISPAMNARENLKKSIPQLREQHAQVLALSKQASSLSVSAQATVLTMSKTTLTTTLAARGLKAQSVLMMGSDAQVILQDVSFAQTLAWLDTQQKTDRILVADAKITALDKPDQINATFTLTQAIHP